ncbi:hypothetical protein GCM10010276_14620 [Streptomyces longisporus]|uniref:Uncharacterized protein n=1 Tax=Streptomyces longisporus TaxID=1948 RepID=A0ABN3L7F3_STRLO
MSTAQCASSSPIGVDGVEGAVAAAEGVVGDEDVEPSAQRRGGRGDEFVGCGRVGEAARTGDDPGRGMAVSCGT